ncbi:MAG: YegP family protein [Epsilonproteobacteria bacterium]|nr:YegP family protein [Campylobacterota bacterium]
MEIILRKREGDSPFSFVFKDGDKVIIKSETYKAKKSALNGIESVKKNCQIDSRYEFKQAKNGKFFFNIKASNGQIVGTSGFFDTEEERQAAIEKLKKEAPNAPVKEEI